MDTKDIVQAFEMNQVSILHLENEILDNQNLGDLDCDFDFDALE